jgi:hypothetical protein
MNIEQNRQGTLTWQEIRLTANLFTPNVAGPNLKLNQDRAVGRKPPTLILPVALLPTQGTVYEHNSYGCPYVKLRLTTVGDPPRWPRDTPLSTKVDTKFRRQVAVDQSV